MKLSKPLSLRLAWPDLSMGVKYEGLFFPFTIYLLSFHFNGIDWFQRFCSKKFCIPDKVPTLMTRVSTRVSSVIVGPRRETPRAIFCLTSSRLEELSASWAKVVAFDRSIKSKKKKRASLEKKAEWHWISRF